MRPLFYVARDNLINTIQYYNTATPEQQWTIACMPNAEMSHVLPKMTAVPSCDQMYFISTDCLPSTPCTKHCGTFQTTCCTFLQLAPRIYQICHLIDALLYSLCYSLYSAAAGPSAGHSINNHYSLFSAGRNKQMHK